MPTTPLSCTTTTASVSTMTPTMAGCGPQRSPGSSTSFPISSQPGSPTARSTTLAGGRTTGRRAIASPPMAAAASGPAVSAFTLHAVSSPLSSGGEHAFGNASLSQTPPSRRSRGSSPSSSGASSHRSGLRQGPVSNPSSSPNLALRVTPPHGSPATGSATATGQLPPLQLPQAPSNAVVVLSQPQPQPRLSINLPTKERRVEGHTADAEPSATAAAAAPSTKRTRPALTLSVLPPGDAPRQSEAHSASADKQQLVRGNAAAAAAERVKQASTPQVIVRSEHTTGLSPSLDSSRSGEVGRTCSSISGSLSPEPMLASTFGSVSSLNGGDSESRLSKCKRRMQGFAKPAFDMRKVEAARQESFQMFMSSQADEAHDGGSQGAVASAPATERVQRLGGNGFLQMALPGAECCFDDGIVNAAECHPISQVNDYIFLGTWRDAKDTKLLKQYGITYVLNCAKEVEHGSPESDPRAQDYNFDLGNRDLSVLFGPENHYLLDDGECSSCGHTVSPCGSDEEAQSSTSRQTPAPDALVRAHIPMVDNHKERLEESLGAAFFFITLAHKHNGRVLVHCRRGISRSAAIVTAFTMATQRMSFDDAYHFVQEKRSCVSLNLAFQEYLSEEFKPDPRWASLNEHIARTLGNISPSATKRASTLTPPLRVLHERGATTGTPDSASGPSATRPPLPLPAAAADDFMEDDAPFSPLHKTTAYSFERSGGFGADGHEDDAHSSHASGARAFSSF